MNEHFVPIKLDREERPDLDAIYMEACQAMTGHGGWPLNVFLTPEQVPFYAGTYFPPEDRRGMPSWRRVLEAVAEAWTESATRSARAPNASSSGSRAVPCSSPAEVLDPRHPRRGRGDACGPLRPRSTAASGAPRSSRSPLRSSYCSAAARPR